MVPGAKISSFLARKVSESGRFALKANKNRVKIPVHIQGIPLTLAFLTVPTLIGPYTRLHPLSTCLSGRLPAPRRRDKYLLFKIPALRSRAGPKINRSCRGVGRRSARAREGEEESRAERGVDYKPKATEKVVGATGEERGRETVDVRAQGR